MSEEDEVTTFERGSALSIFTSDRREDYMALTFALIIAFWVYVAY
ncbi:MAG: hypothetical protein BMS9Abin25_0580 [Gammaproteobacteria bacterium]|nr:MAG: hypothetical protein BMS9Abin25_0580 [Gammaproteobacteria bacterium]